MVPPLLHSFFDDDFFTPWFGTGPRIAPTQSLDFEVEAEISLEEAFRGARRQLASDSFDPFVPRYLEVNIPPGAETGWRLTAPGLGRRGFGGRGDLLVRVVVAPHPRLRRSGDDLHTEVMLPLTTAVLGGTVDVEGIAEKTAVEVPPLTVDEQVFRLDGLGMSVRGSSRRGDLFVLARVQLPSNLDARQRQLFEALRQSGF